MVSNVLFRIFEFSVSVSATCKSLCNLHELYIDFKEKHPNVSIGFSKFYTLTPKWCVLAGLKMTHSFYTESNKFIRHWGESCPGTATLKEFLDQELNKHEDDEKFNYCPWDTTDRPILTTFTATYKEYKETLIDVIDDLTRHSYIAKLKITSS